MPAQSLRKGSAECIERKILKSIKNVKCKLKALAVIKGKQVLTFLITCSYTHISKNLSTGLPHYNAIFGVSRKGCVITETML